VIIEILFIMTMFLWGLTCIPHPSLAPFAWSNGLLAWIAVLLLGLAFYAPGLGGGRVGMLRGLLDGLRAAFLA
jgi:hypothetical protein